MPWKALDLTGKRFGSLVAVELLDKDDPRCIATTHERGRQWLCKCDCGNDKVVFANVLNAGRVHSCGCQQYVKSRGRKAVDLTGKRFGHLTVLCKAKREYCPDDIRRWLCICDCGSETYASAYQLQEGEKKTCGFKCEYHYIPSHKKYKNVAVKTRCLVD